MIIDKTGKLWVGTDPADIQEYLIAYEAAGGAVDEVRLCKCTCGSDAFRLEADREEECAQRHCATCSASRFIGDSGEYWDDATPSDWRCTECGAQTCNIGIGFALRDPSPDAPEGQRDVRWISVGTRCEGCGTLACYLDWKISYGPSHDLLEQA